jgi:hypothetical protein
LRELVESMLSLAEFSTPRRVVPVVTADSEDDKILACARAARVHWLVSGDERLLAAGHYHEIQIVDPRTFLTALQASGVPGIREGEQVNVGNNVPPHRRGIQAGDLKQSNTFEARQL